MPNGNSPQDTPSQPQPPKTSSGNDGDQQRTPKNAPQSPALSFAPAASPSGPQSPSYQIQQLVMSRNPATGQNVNITLQNVGPVVAGSQQITLTPLPIPNPASPGFQFSSQPRRFEHGSPSYIQVTSPMPQQVQTQSPTLPNAVPIQALQGVRTGTAGAGLGMCSQSPTRGFVDANLLVRQISLGPSSTGHFVFQEGSGIAQITQGAQVHLPSATPTTVPARTLQHSNSQTVGPVHQFGSQSPVVGGANLQTLTTPSHITTTNLQPQISSIIQGQLIQQQKLLHGQQLGRTISFDRASGGMVAGVAGASAFGIASPPTPTSPSRAAGPQGLSSLPLTPTVKKQSKKLEEVPPATQEDARMRKQCLELHHKHVKVLKENLKEYLIELFFLQHFQGNMMDFLAFKKKPTMGLQGYLRQSDLDLEDEDGEKKSSHISHNQPLDGAASPVIECPIAMETQASDKQKATQIERSVKRSPDSSQQEFGYQHPKVTPVVPPLPPTPGRPGAMPPSQQTAQPAGHKQSDAIKSPPAQNAASLQTASRAQAPNPTISSSLPPATQVAPLQSAELPTQVKRQPPGSPTLLSVQQLLDQPSSLKPPSMLASASKLGSEAGKLTVPGSINAPPSSPATPATPANIPESTPPAANVSPKRILSPGGSKAVSPSASKSPSGAGAQPQDTRSLASDTGGIEQEAAAVHKPPDQENQVHQRIGELRKEGLWSLRRLPKLQEASRPKSHWDYLLEEMQWMAADFAQERMWKVASAKKLVRTAARHCHEKQQMKARARKEEEDRLRRIAALAAREIHYFWANIEQVVEIKLQVQLQEKRKRAIRAQRRPPRGQDAGNPETRVKAEPSLEPAVSGTKTKSEASKAEKGSEECRVSSDGAQKQVILIDSLLNIDQYRGNDGASATHLGVRKHSRDIAEVAAAAELLLPRGSSRVTAAVKMSCPSLLHGSLREYQQIGLDWLVKQYRKNLNGILADETGLGKNVQVIALLAHLAGNEGVWGPHLIVARSCKIAKWQLELKRWCPALKLLLYFGSQRELQRKRQEWGEPNCFNVCITSYKQLFKGHQAFMKMRWKYLVLDELHQIKNMTEKHWEAVFNLPSQRRLLLRDTPLQNTWMDLWTMVHFLIPGLSRPYLDFPVKAGSDQDQDYCHKVVIRLHRMTQPFILRRSKRDVERQLTKKSEHVLKCQLSNRQKTLYEDVMMQPGTQDALKGGHFVSVLHVLMQLQRICNHPELVDPRPARSSYVCDALQYDTASLILQALAYDPWKNADLSLFDVLGLENRMTRYEAQVLPKQKVSRKLVEEIYTSADPAPRPKRVKIKPCRLFEPVLYGQKPEGRMVTFPSAPATRIVTTTTATITQQGQVRGRSPMTATTASQVTKALITQPQTSQVSGGIPRQPTPVTFSTAAAMRQRTPGPPAPPHTVQQSVLSQRLVLSSQARLPSGEVVKIAQLAAGGAQGRIAQAETPVTLQFQGNKFTLSQSQLRQLTAGQPLQLQGNVLQIVSAPGQYLRPQGSVVMPAMPQGAAANAIRSQQPTGAPQLGAVTPAAIVAGRNMQAVSAAVNPATAPKAAPAVIGRAQESAEEKQRVMERLDRLFSCNERRCGRAPLYGADLLSVCSLGSAEARPPISHTHWGWTGSMTCLLSSRSPEGSSDPLRHLILSPDQQKAALEPLAKRALCVVPAVVAAPPALSVAHPPPSYTHGMKLLCHGLREQAAPYLQHLREKTSPHCVQFPDLRLIQCDSGKLEALVILLRKLRSEGRRVLIFSQMLLMLDILDLFLDLHSLTFLRIDEFANYEQCQDLMKSFNRDPQIFCVLLSTHSCSLGVPHVDADTVIFYDNDLNPVMDGKTQSWCDLIGRSKDIYIYRLVSASSIEEKLLKTGTKDLIREVAAQGSDYSLAFLTQQTIQELFEVCSPLEDAGFRVKAEEFVLLSQEPSPSDAITPKVARPFVEALDRIECGEEEDTTEHVQEDGPKPNAGIRLSEDCRPLGGQDPSPLQELADLMQTASFYDMLFFAGGPTVMAQPLHVQPLLKLKQHHIAQQQKALQSQSSMGQQKITTPQVSAASQQQKVTYTTQPAIKTQFLTTSLAQAQKQAATQMQAQIQVAKLPQVVQQQAALAALQQVVSASQQIQSQTVTLTQTTAAGQQQVQVIPAGSAAAQVVQQKLLHQQQQMVTAASTQIKIPAIQSMAPAPGTADTQNPQAKLQVRTPTFRIKAPTKPS
ncbi:E1A-binding protein p400-like [Ascaphus truei]|uniref:E1A-binding protein p400-like n=1 Tax=Ascaphus truei TaxID=8439 RepID=UPI003F593778